ncbi:MAG: hypothetical protein JNL08_16415 [Planctomycetes bacterium]|nr:hypothetical protein [Planctomycetota bacterium]
MRRLLAAVFAAATCLPAQAPAARFANGPPTEPAWFPLAVWLQSPHHAGRYRELGVNLFIGLWQGPTQAQLDALDAAGMKVICEQNEVGLAHRGGTIIGWMHQDEPDNAQARAVGYGPPVAPAEIARRYEAMRKADPTRPVFLNLGQGAAWDGWHGRGVRTNHPEDYPEYLKGCDIGCFDIYPVTHTHRDVQGRLEWVARGVQRLRQGCRDQKPIWACIEATHIDNQDVRPTPQQVQDEVWLAICAGAQGIVWFAHQFAPSFVEAGLLQHDEIRDAVRDVHAAVLAVAPVLHAERADAAVVVTTRPKAEVAVRAHRHDGALHVFVASLAPGPVTARVQLRERKAAQVRIDGGAAAALQDGACTVALRGYGHAHLVVE